MAQPAGDCATPSQPEKANWRVSEVRQPAEKDWRELTSVSTDTVLVKVGKAGRERSFRLNPDMLARKSAFFQAALSKDWKEAKEGVVTLPEDDVAVFETFVQFILFDYIEVIVITEHNDTNPLAGIEQELEHLARSWVLGDKLQAVSFKDAAMDALCECMGEYEHAPTGTLVRIAYEQTSPGSALRRMVIEGTSRHWAGEDFETKDEPSWPYDFLMDVVKRCKTDLDKRRISGQTDDDEDPCDLAGCHFHEHAPGKKNCYDQD